MKVIHSLDGYSSESFVINSPSFLLSNKKGGFFIEGIKSRYAGFYINENNKTIKIIDAMLSNSRTKEINNKLWSIEKKKQTFSESFFVPFDSSSLVYETSNGNEIELILDVKGIFDNREWGRFYEIIPNKEGIIIKFSKKTDRREDKTASQPEYDIYLAIKGENLKCRLLKNWVKKSNDYDKKRNSKPFERYVYSALKLHSKKIVFSASFSRKKAAKESSQVFKNLKKLKENQEKSFNKVINSQFVKSIKHRQLQLYSICALSGIFSNIVKIKNNQGIYAGFPWFLQFWTRDELVSAKALILNSQLKEAKDILLKNLKGIQRDGRLLNMRYPQSQKTNADAIFWLFKRIDDFGINNFSAKEKALIKNRLVYSIERIKQNYFRNGFIYNNPLETWMDTEWNTNNREGFCIEIQAMFLYALELAYNLTKNPIYNIEKAHLLKKTRDNFFINDYLYDRIKDPAIRPNLFIAYYFYPDLLTRHEWERCFKIIIPKLWLEFGGFSTIEKTNPLFCSEYTGEIPKSYHRGDSWFWLNYLAAIALYRTDKITFKKYIDKIISTAKKITEEGTLSHFPELSSAGSLRLEGSPSQAWSAAMFIELMHEIH